MVDPIVSKSGADNMMSHFETLKIYNILWKKDPKFMLYNDLIDDVEQFWHIFSN